MTAADDSSLSAVIYDQSGWENEAVLKLFSTAWDAGRNYPTKDELRAVGPLMDFEFARSHTRTRSIDKDASKNVVSGSTFNPDRKLWYNCPGGAGKNTGGWPSKTFDQDVFSLWNYVSLWGAWNYSFLQAPGAWVDAAHKAGTRAFGGIKFFESWNNDGSEAAFNAFIQTKATSGNYTYKYSRAFVNAACFFGNDGYNYNQEGSTYTDTDWVAFHKEVRAIARELNLPDFGIGQYTQNAGLSSTNLAQSIYGDSDGVIFDCMLNYSGNLLSYRTVPTALNNANATVGNPDYLYQGQLLVGVAGDYWTQMNTATTNKINIAIWGEHDQSRFFQFRVGDDPISIQENYQGLLEKAFSGAYRNPLKRPAINNNWGKFQVSDASEIDTQLANSPGFASMFPERTAIVFDLPFETHFSLGNGENYFYKGKVTNGPWYNMSQQDIVPTYRWLVCAKGDMTTYANDITARFTHEDAYVGGSSLKLTGATTSGNDVVLYRTKLTSTTGNVKTTIAFKTPTLGNSPVSLIVKKEGASSWIEIPFGNVTAKTWNEITLDIPGIAAGDVIEYVGLRVNGTTTSDWTMFVGKLKIHDDRRVQQALIDESSLEVEVRNENTKSLDIKLRWEPDYAGYTTSVDKFGMVYNDEINVDHFEILFKDKDGKVTEVGRTAQWCAYVGGLPVAQTDDVYIGVRSVSVDLQCMSPTKWIKIPHYTGTLPEPVEANPYGDSWMTDNGNGTIANCRKNIYAEKVSTTGATQNLNYYVSANPIDYSNADPTILTGPTTEQYYFAKDHKLILTQGQTVTLTFKGYNSGTGESLKYDFLNAYIDYDGNYSFLDADEVLGKFGKLNAGTDDIVNPGVNLIFTVPEDAHIGESRLRIVGSDAWDPHPGPTGGTKKGYSIDFPVEIQGTNPDRGPAETYKDRRDQGEPESPEFVEDGVMGIEDVVNPNAEYATVTIEGTTAFFTNMERAWFYDMTGRMVKYVANGEESVSVADLAAGVYIVKMLNDHIITSAKVIVK